jgi:hypothetical protein
MNQATYELRVRVTWVNPAHLFRRLDRLNGQIDHDGLLTAAHDHAAQLLLWACVDLLMRHERWHIDKVARSCFRGEYDLSSERLY